MRIDVRGRRKLVTGVGAVVAVVAVLVSGCSSSKTSSSGGSSTAAAGGSSSASDSGPGVNAGQTVNLVAYSVPKPAYDLLTAGFQKTPEGKGVKFSASYGASGAQSTAVSSGQKADYVAFSVTPDLTKLVPTFVDAGWNTGPTKGLVSNSVVVIAVRKGNPKHITGWDDLIKPGVKIVTPDPASSGSAKWNILAAYTHITAEGGSEADAQAYLKSFFANVVSKPTSGSVATSTFLSGTGDVLISYEDEAIDARQANQALDYIVPKESVLIQNPAAVTLSGGTAAKAFLAYVESDAGQKLFVQAGFRPVLTSVSASNVKGANDPANPFPTVTKLTTIDDLGGWPAVNTKYFDKTNGIVTKIESG
jgi:sulfate/thiosulfate transport system substrate-binding protein